MNYLQKKSIKDKLPFMEEKGTLRSIWWAIVKQQIVRTI
jgi:hypothetical protein